MDSESPGDESDDPLDGGELKPLKERLGIGVEVRCDNCGSLNISGQIHCAVCSGLVNDV